MARQGRLSCYGRHADGGRGAARYSSEWEKTVKRIGRWIDFKEDYKTLDPSYMESVWWVFSELHKKGLVYRGFKARLQLLQAIHWSHLPWLFNALVSAVILIRRALL